MTEADWITFLQRPDIPAFNRAMLVNPVDDLPRLVFADWLDENCPDEELCATVRESITGLPRLYTCNSLPVSSEVSVHIYRGRLRLEVEPDSTRPDHHSYRAMWDSGWVGRVELRDSLSVAVAAWLIHPGMAGVEWLEIDNAGVEEMEMVATAGHLNALSHLDLSMSRLGHLEGPRALASAKLPALRSLVLYGSSLRDDGVVELAAAPAFAGLATLNLGYNQIGPIGVRALADSQHLTRLQSLCLSDNAIGNEGMIALFGSPTFAALHSLDLVTVP